MRFEHPLDDLFAGRSTVRILRALDELPDGLAVSARELARRSGLSHPTASKVLAELVTQGFAVVRRAPGVDAFGLNRSHVLVEKIQPLFEWERQLMKELIGFLRREIERKAPAVTEAYLFGSVVRGAVTYGSDVDLAATTSPRELGDAEDGLARVAAAFRDRFGNRLEVIVESSPIEKLRRLGPKQNGLWARIARDGIPVIDRRKAGAIRGLTRRSGSG